MPTDERVSVILDSDDGVNGCDLVAIGDRLNVEVVNGSSSDSNKAEED